MKASQFVQRALAAGCLIGLIASQASAATCSTGKLAFPGVNKLQVKNLSCGGSSSKHNVENIGGSKRVFAKLFVGKSARTNGITSANVPMNGCFTQDDTANNVGTGDTSGCDAAAFWIGTLFI